VRSPLKLLRYPGIQTFSCPLGSHIQFTVEIRTGAQHELAGKGLIRLFTALSAELQVVFYRVTEGRLQLLDRSALEGDYIASIDDLTAKNPGFIIEFHATYIAFMFQHAFLHFLGFSPQAIQGSIPASVRNRRIDFTAPLSVSFSGCGR